MLVSTSWFCSGPSKLTPLFSRSQDCHQACCEEAPCLRTQVPRKSTHGGLSSDSEGRASKVHKQCGTCRPSGTPRRRVRKAGRRQRSKGCRVAWEERSQWGRISGAAHLIQTMTVLPSDTAAHLLPSIVSVVPIFACAASVASQLIPTPNSTLVSASHPWYMGGQRNLQ